MPGLLDYKAALPALQAAFAPIAAEGQTITVEPIESLDVYYTDGSAVAYTGKITILTPPFGLKTSWFFTPAGPVDHFPTLYDPIFRKWIASVR